jgi:hypothetical protein
MDSLPRRERDNGTSMMPCVRDMRSIMMRYSTLILILACMTATGNLYALSAADDSKTKSTQQTEPKKSSQPAKQGMRQSAKPAATFKPSERIGADSAVSFPVDI